MSRIIGTDVSHWQGNIDFDKMKAAGAQFVFMKASQAAWTDQRFVRNWQAAKDAGIFRGAYHFIDWTRTAQQQADHFSNVLLAHGMGDLPPVADFELRQGAPSQPQATLFLRVFCERVEANTGKRPMVYTAPYVWREMGSTDPYWRRYDLWLAHYTTASNPLTTPPWHAWKFWQFTERGPGSVYGVSSAAIDLNYWHGTLDELREYAGVKPEPPPMPEPPGGLDWLAWRVETDRRLERLEKAAGLDR
jgi:lysozyme